MEKQDNGEHWLHGGYGPESKSDVEAVPADRMIFIRHSRGTNGPGRATPRYLAVSPLQGVDQGYDR